LPFDRLSSARATERPSHVTWWRSAPTELEKVYKHEGKCRREKMTPEERLAYHQEKSRPTMDKLEAWLRKQLDEKLVEPNGTLGEATEYMLNRWDKLTRFLTVAGAPIDNNICERALKRAIRHRKNSLFYKTLHGARVGDIYMSLIHTCELNGINPFTYLTQPVRGPRKYCGRLLLSGKRLAGHCSASMLAVAHAHAGDLETDGHNPFSALSRFPLAHRVPVK